MDPRSTYLNFPGGSFDYGQASKQSFSTKMERGSSHESATSAGSYHSGLSASTQATTYSQEDWESSPRTPTNAPYHQYANVSMMQYEVPAEGPYYDDNRSMANDYDTNYSYTEAVSPGSYYDYPSNVSSTHDAPWPMSPGGQSYGSQDADPYAHYSR
jgi:hypothetical protein